jgi:hypothetical protein
MPSRPRMYGQATRFLFTDPVVAISLAESSAKTRSGPPNDDEADKTWPVWAGVIPLSVEGLGIRSRRGFVRFTCRF